MEKHWLSIEKLVQLIEKSISPSSKVEHNVKLPDLTSIKRRFRQCDIVITSGSPKRQTVTIVEVQNRSSKLNLNTFQGFVKKMTDVGAQHLICVSTKGFSDTIIEKARNSGGTIRLVTLNKFEPDNFPTILPSLEVVHNISEIEILDYTEILFNSEKEIIIDLTEMIFEIPQLNEKFDYISLAKYILSYIIKPNKSGDITFCFPHEIFELNIHYNRNIYNVKSLKCYIKFNVINHQIPVYGYTYEQIDSGAIAWVMESYSEVNEIKRYVKMPLTLNDDGTFSAKIYVSK